MKSTFFESKLAPFVVTFGSFLALGAAEALLQFFSL